MVGTILYQLTRSMTPEQIKRSGYDTYFVDHTAGVFPQFCIRHTVDGGDDRRDGRCDR